MRRLLMYYRSLVYFAPEFDQAPVSGWFVTGSDVADDRFVQLQNKNKHDEDVMTHPKPTN